MTTASDYRKYAEECIRDARSAVSEPIRNQFLDLATLWLTAAARLDAESAPPRTNGKLDGANWPGTAGVE